MRNSRTVRSGAAAPRLVIFGIDGADHDVVSLGMRDGWLPALASLAARGSWGRLESTFPPHTALAWPSIFTGVGPGEHGVYQFWRTQHPGYHPPVATSADYAFEPLWLTLARHGLTAGVVNVPMTHPPAPLPGGYMLSWPLSRTIHYAHPPALLGELARAGVHYQSDLATMTRGEPDYPERAVGFVDGRTRSLLHLLAERPVDVLTAVYTEVDRVGHPFWGGGDEPAEPVRMLYRAVDDALGRLVERLPAETTVVVVSDHGFGPCRGNVQVHELLAQSGLLAYRLEPEPEDGPPRGHDELYDEGADSWFRSGRRYRRAIDWSRTRAFMPVPGCFGVNLNLRGRQEEGIVAPGAPAAEVELEVVAAFGQLRDAAGGAMFEVVRREEVYRGARVAGAPDLLLRPSRWDVMPHPGLDGEVLSPPTQLGVHRPGGVWLAAGPEVPAGRGGAGRVEDVAPTVLGLLGLPVQEGVEGASLVGAALAREPRAPAPAQPEGGLTPDEQRALETRLRALGYL